jgi:hypothetical protein
MPPLKLLHNSKFLGLRFRKDVKYSVKTTAMNFTCLDACFMVGEGRGAEACSLLEAPNTP